MKIKNPFKKKNIQEKIETIVEKALDILKFFALWGKQIIENVMIKY